jgi:hypothetical protein
MTPVQSQSIGQYQPAAPAALAGSGRPPAPTAATALNAASSPSRSAIDGVQTSSEIGPVSDWQPPNLSVGGPIPNSGDGSSNAPPNPVQGSTTQGSTGNSFLDLISQLMNQLDSVISGLGAGANPSGGGGGSTSPPVCTTTFGPDPGNSTSLPNPGGSAMRQLLATGEVT